MDIFYAVTLTSLRNIRPYEPESPTGISLGNHGWLTSFINGNGNNIEMVIWVHKLVGASASTLAWGSALLPVNYCIVDT